MLDQRKLESIIELEGKEFIETIYRKILLRECDPDGLKSHMAALNNGVSKQYIIFLLRTSDEGISKNVEIKDLNIGEINYRDLVSLSAERFVDTSYVAILGRNADENGKRRYLDSLNDGSMTYLDVLYALRYSEEGNRLGVNVIGLEKAYKTQNRKSEIGNIPVLGKIIKSLWYIAHITSINMRLGSVERHLSKTEQHADSIEQGVGNTEQHVNSAEQHIDRLEQHIIEIDGNLNDTIKRLDRMISAYHLDQIQQKRASQLKMDISYKKYEDEMRGSREEIIERLKIYNAVFERVKASNGEKINTLDLGCGRGEWLELAQNTYNVHALGIDADESMLTDCIENGLSAVNADLVEYIKNAASNSVDIITMFQVAEHLPVSILVEVLNECYRVLKKGGAMIVETPDPENMIIGTCNFYFDPTHITKLPPALLKILVESTGLQEAEVVRMHEYGAINLENEKSMENSAVRQLSVFFNNYADYAVIAYKGG